jgi:uncharacterized membrane protein YphA (DoxX/SURF4 family)
MLARRWTRTAAILLGVLFYAAVLAFGIIRAIRLPLDIGIRTIVFEPLALGSAALMLAGMLPADRRYAQRWQSASDYLIGSSKYVFALSSIVFGVDHFLIIPFIASLVPSWIPGAYFWAYLTGAGFVAAGLSIATGLWARWGGFFLGLMFALWFLALHLPRIMGIAGIKGAPTNPNEWSSAMIALGMCGASWVAAEAAGKNVSSDAFDARSSVASHSATINASAR